jgi:hypothetical protein
MAGPAPAAKRNASFTGNKPADNRTHARMRKHACMASG